MTSNEMNSISNSCYETANRSLLSYLLQFGTEAQVGDSKPPLSGM